METLTKTKTKNRKEIIADACKDLEFVSGLKQFREYTNDDKQRLINCLYDCVNSYIWLNNKRLEYILHNGIRGNYGEFFGLNERTLTKWINHFYENNKQQIILEITPKEEEKELSQEEKDYWIEKGKRRFIENWEKSKNGLVPDLDEWAPYWYNKMVDKGLLKESEYNIDFVSVEQKKMLKINKPFFGESDLVASIRNRIWKMFIKNCQQKNIDLPKYI